MREIKFRAWVEEEDGPVLKQVLSMDFAGSHLYVTVCDDDDGYSHQNPPVMQYTGLKDAWASETDRHHAKLVILEAIMRGTDISVKQADDILSALDDILLTKLDDNKPKTALSKGQNPPVMQYTGLKDCNGKEIYEGDILRRERDGEKYTFYIVVEFSSGCFGGVTRPGFNHYLTARQWGSCDSDGGGYDEIIGNIYENPELINK